MSTSHGSRQLLGRAVLGTPSVGFRFADPFRSFLHCGVHQLTVIVDEGQDWNTLRCVSSYASEIFPEVLLLGSLHSAIHVSGIAK